MNEYKINNINYEAIKGVKMTKEDEQLLKLICEDAEKDPALWEMLRKNKSNNFKGRLWCSWFDDLCRIEEKYKVKILLPVSWKQLQQWGRIIKQSKAN